MSSNNRLDWALAAWIVVAGGCAILVSYASLRIAGGDMAMAPMVIAFVIDSLVRYVYLLVLTGCIVGVALKATRRISDRRK